ncbi:hypothetical protein FT663_02028 [Candidozyma haemuli var. vulneris]|uniref:Thiamine pyrophosphokinase n=1 Tax=Candidozyma haemuli TaxID=45357 RepID=A0A2V1AN28_9ASCO|nr:thiamine pyrophosphokinase [[Candida] haemuloni]KAF3991840.1 hypothetical protein FT662_01457 [[Candida] haemuloni var. vulneris]KAF3993197.1 hypothetical protein FT663_02028 [[Candida] haemuloni var. vulneris]PVH18966.1 thiamine pyrophosphokinase [[Candida] haemuloni]
MEELIIERPDDFEVDEPQGKHLVLEPFNFFSDSLTQTAVLIILNTAIEKLPIFQLWTCTSVHICADGGANQLYYHFSSEQERERYIPDFIVGDFDSLRDEVKQYYRSKGTVVIPQYSQYATDFMKAIDVALLAHTSGKDELYKQVDDDSGLAKLVKKYQERVPFTAYIAGGIGGRFDQTFHSINQLYATKLEFPNIRLFFVSDNDLVFLAPTGTTYVKFANKKLFNQHDPVPKLGLLPFGNRVILTTKGLKYDVENWVSQVGGNVSTSNGVSGTTGFVIEATDDIVVNIEISHGPETR